MKCKIMKVSNAISFESLLNADLKDAIIYRVCHQKKFLMVLHTVAILYIDELLEVPLISNRKYIQIGIM